MKDFSNRYKTYLQTFESALEEACAGMHTFPAVLGESMRYSLNAGGKRIRPVLFLSALDGLHVPYEVETDLAVAIECIHTYSLIHDDLPCMDDDDMRRGKPSSHKMFGEANAVLAGDALLSHALILLLKAAERGETHRRAALTLAEAAGADGMVGGQSADLFFEHAEPNAGVLHFIHEHKTARMIAAPLVMAAQLAACDPTPFERFGMELGILFQLTDDLLDDGQDEAQNAVKVYGREQVERDAREAASYCKSLLTKLPGDTEFLDGIVDLVLNRKN